MLCQEWVVCKAQGDSLTVSLLKCKCWSCELCAPINSARLMRQAFLGQPDTFLTLTVNPKWGHSPDSRAQDLSRAWRLLRERIKRKYRYPKLPFLAVFERTKAGEPHLHILLRVRWIDQRWLSAQMADLIAAPIVDIRRIRGLAKIAAYVAKYIGKDPTKFLGTKRYWSSQDYGLPDPRELAAPPWDDPTFKVHRCGMVSFLAGARRDGFFVSKVVEGVHHMKYDWERSQRPPGGARVAL